MSDIFKCPKCGVELGKKEGNWVTYPNTPCTCGYNYDTEFMEYMISQGAPKQRKKKATQ